MRKKILIAFFGTLAGMFLFFSGNAQAAPSIQITSPRGGEIFHPGDTIQVQWTSSDVDTVYVSLMNQSTSKTSSDRISNSGSYNIVIPSHILTNAGTALIPSLFTVNITGYQTGIGSTDANSNTFCITSGSSCPTVPATTNGPLVLDIVSPKGGEIFRIGDTININWTSTNVDTIVSLDLMLNSTSYAHVSSMSNNNSYSLTIPVESFGVKLPSSDKYTIKVSGGRTGVGVKAAESNKFCITLESTCPSSTSSGGKFTSPMKDARFKIGDTINIAWQTNDPSEKYSSPIFWLVTESSDGLYVLYPISPYKFDTGNMKRFNSASMITNSLSSGSLDWKIPKEFTNMKGIDYTCNLFPDLSHICAEQVGGTTIFHNMPFSFNVLLDSNNDYVLDIVKPDVKESESKVSITTIGAVRTVVAGKYRIFGYLSSGHYQDYTFLHPTPVYNLKQTFGGKTSKFFSDEFFIDDTSAVQLTVPAVIPTAVVSTQTTTLSENSIVKSADNPDVYVIKDGKKEKIQDPETFNKRGYKWNQIQEISANELSSIPTLTSEAVPAVSAVSGSPAYPNGTLIKAVNGNDVYVIINGNKRKIPDPATFNKFGYKWDQIKKIDGSVLSRISDDANIYVPVTFQTTQASPTSIKPGILIKSADNPTVYYITKDGMKKSIPTIEVFNSYNNKWQDVKVTQKETLDVLPAVRAIKLENGDGKVYMLENKSKRWVKTAVALQKLGINQDQVVSVNQTELDAYPDGEVIE